MNDKDTGAFNRRDFLKSGSFATVMAMLGGMRAPFGPLIGATTFLVLEDVLARATDYPNLIIGPLLLIVAIYVNGGIDGLIGGARRG